MNIFWMLWSIWQIGEVIAETQINIEWCPKQWDQSWPWIGRRVMVRESHFGLEVWKDCFAGGTVIEDLADRTTQKWQQTWKSENTVRCGSHQRWKSARLVQKFVDLLNDLGFSLCTVLSVCCMVTTSDRRKKFEMGVSTDWYVAIEHWKLSLIRIIFIDSQTSEL